MLARALVAKATEGKHDGRGSRCHPRYNGSVHSDREHTSSYAQRYERWTAVFRRHPGAARLLAAANRVIVGVFYAAYGLLLGVAVWRLLGEAATVGRALAALAALVLVPGLAFVLLSAVRAHLNEPRPYERDGIVPLVPRDGAGRSFPSRHAFSAFAIAASWGVVAPPVSVVLLGLACLLAVIRVLGGVHYPRDVVVGALCGVAAGAAAAALAFFLGGGALWL